MTEKVKLIFGCIGLLRVVLFPITRLLDKFVTRRVSGTQLRNLYTATGIFAVIEYAVELATSLSLISLNAALQVWRIGDRDQRIQVPYKASGPLPPAVTAGQTQTEAK